MDALLRFDRLQSRRASHQPQVMFRPAAYGRQSEAPVLHKEIGKMGLRFRRTITLIPGVRLNLSKSGVSTSLGPRGMHYTIGPKGTRTTVGLPGSGLSYTQYQRYTDRSHRPLRAFAWLVGFTFKLLVLAVLLAIAVAVFTPVHAAERTAHEICEEAV